MSSSKPKKVKRIRTKLEKRKRGRRILNGFIIFCIVCGLGVGAAGLTIIASIISSSTIVLSVEDFKSPESTIIYDSAGNEIATIGIENRINITYADLPECVVDAFVAVEDSRFFEHNGFDIPRFAKSALENLKSLSFAQGGSTLTMQMVKNTYFVTDEALAEKSIDRKVQEIYLSLKVEKLINKAKIFELYINKINFGGTARGIQAASKYYFGKDCSELTLVEAATMAGVINFPNVFNPYYNIDYATERRDEVLSLMKLHGYITEEEMEVAKKTKIEDLLVGYEEDLSSTKSDYLQSYVDEVLNEIEATTGEDPYTTAMRVYTAMDPRVQKTADNICRGDSFDFPDKYFQVGFAVVNNHNGEIVALGGGRGRTGQRVFSFATDARKQPGSSIKVILDYALAFEYAGITTAHVELDDKTTWAGSSFQVTNASGKYNGDTKLQHALSASLNIPAVKLLRKVLNAVGNDDVIEYLKAIGYDANIAENFTEQYAIGGGGMQASPLQMAAAQAMLFNDGEYIEPHTIRRIEYVDGSQEPYVPEYQGVQVISPAAAWCIASMMEKNVSNDIYLGNVKAIKKSYPVYAKTGTSDWGTDGVKYGIPVAAAKDSWMNASTSQFTIGCWVGYDKPIKGKNTYIRTAVQQKNYPAKIDNRILNALEKSFGTPKAIKKPSDVTSVSHVLGTWPYMAAPEWCPKKYVTSGYCRKGKVSVTKWETPTIDENYEFTAHVVGNSGTGANVTCRWTDIDPNLPTVVESTTYKLKSGKKGKRLFSTTWIDGIVQYYVGVYEGNTLITTLSTSVNGDTLYLDLSSLSNGTHTLTLRGYHAYTIAPVQTSVVEQTITVHVSNWEPDVPPVDPGPESNPVSDTTETNEVSVITIE